MWKYLERLKALDLMGLYSVQVLGYWGFGDRLGEVFKRVFVLYNLGMSDRLSQAGSFLFHWGIWIALFGHLSMIVPPENFGMSKEVHKAIALYVGRAAFIGLVLLVRRLSFLDGRFALVLLAIVGLGNVQTLVLRSDYMETVSPWPQNVLTGNSMAGVEKMAEANVATKVHAALVMLFIA